MRVTKVFLVVEQATTRTIVKTTIAAWYELNLLFTFSGFPALWHEEDKNNVLCCPEDVVFGGWLPLTVGEWEFGVESREGSPERGASE